MPQSYGTANMVLPAKAADGAPKIARLDSYGDGFVVPLSAGLSGLASEGSYYRACNPTPGTALTQAVTASFAATTPLLCIRNNESAGGKTVYLDYMRLLMTIIPASATSWDMAVTIDPNARAPTAGTAITGASVNTGFSAASIATMTFGPTSVAAAVAQRLISRARIFAVVPVVGSVLLMNFGAQDSGVGQTINGANAVNLSCPVGPTAIAPGHTGLIHMWYTANATTGASYEVELAWWER